MCFAVTRNRCTKVVHSAPEIGAEWTTFVQSKRLYNCSYRLHRWVIALGKTLTEGTEKSRGPESPSTQLYEACKSTLRKSVKSQARSMLGTVIKLDQAGSDVRMVARGQGREDLMNPCNFIGRNLDWFPIIRRSHTKLFELVRPPALTLYNPPTKYNLEFWDFNLNNNKGFTYLYLARIHLNARSLYNPPFIQWGLHNL